MKQQSNVTKKHDEATKQCDKAMKQHNDETTRQCGKVATQGSTRHIKMMKQQQDKRLKRKKQKGKKMKMRKGEEKSKEKGENFNFMIQTPKSKQRKNTREHNMHNA
jgi:hypothetical protein